MIKLLIYVCLLHSSESTTTYVQNLALFNGIINSADTVYDSTTPPTTDGWPTAPPAGWPTDPDAPIVKLGMNIEKVTSFNTIAMDFTMVIYLRQQWIDTRLIDSTGVGTEFKLDSSSNSLIWHPDLFVSEARKVTRNSDEQMVKINLGTGEVFTSERLTIKMRCPMDFRNFPFDSHYCPIEFISFAYAQTVYDIQWMDHPTFQKGGGIGIDQFQAPEFFKRKSPKICKRSPATGESPPFGDQYPCVHGLVVFHRQFIFYLINGYFPSFLCVVISMLGYFVFVNAIPARVGLGVMTYLALQTQITNFSKYVPKVSYVKSIDVWMMVSYIFVLASLVEFVVASWYAKKPEMMKKIEAQAKIELKKLERREEAWKNGDKKVKRGMINPRYVLDWDGGFKRTRDDIEAEIETYEVTGDSPITCCGCTDSGAAQCFRDKFLKYLFNSCPCDRCKCPDLICTGKGGLADAYRIDTVFAGFALFCYSVFILAYVSFTLINVVLIDNIKDSDGFDNLYEQY